MPKTILDHPFDFSKNLFKLAFLLSVSAIFFMSILSKLVLIAALISSIIRNFRFPKVTINKSFFLLIIVALLLFLFPFVMGKDGFEEFSIKSFIVDGLFISLLIFYPLIKHSISMRIDELERIAWSAILFHIILTIIYLLLGGDFFWIDYGDSVRFKSILGSATLAIFCVSVLNIFLCSALLRGKKMSASKDSLCLLLFIALISTGARTSILVGVLNTYVYLIYINRKRKGLKYLMTLLLSFFIFISFFLMKDRIFFDNVYELKHLNFSGRLEIWSELLRHIRESIFLGHGQGSSNYFLINISKLNEDQPHNEFIRFLHNYGIAGSLILGFLFVRRINFFKIYSNIQTRGVAIICFCTCFFLAMTDNPSIYIFLYMPLFFIYSSCDGVCRDAK